MHILEILPLLLNIRSVELAHENTNAIATPHGEFQYWKQTTMASLDMLSLVSKAFMEVTTTDTLFLKFKRKNERLRLEGFWKDYNIDMLRKELSRTMNILSLFYCDCVSCVAHARVGELEEGEFYEDIPPPRQCYYVMWVCEFIEDMRMGTRVARNDEMIESEYFWICEGAQIWYGPYLTDAQSVFDPDLRKLKEMFDTLYSMRKDAEPD
jgi:hypothetical protein